MCWYNSNCSGNTTQSSDGYVTTYKCTRCGYIRKVCMNNFNLIEEYVPSSGFKWRYGSKIITRDQYWAMKRGERVEGIN